MKDKNLKVLLAVTGVFSTILAVRESRKMKKMMEETREERRERVEEQLTQLKKDWNNEEKHKER